MNDITLPYYISANRLHDLYLIEKKSVSQIAAIFKCSENKISYWLEKYEIPKRDISDAVYIRKNPKGDPFSLTMPVNTEEGILYGLGLGLYWGEGAKRGTGGMRITNSDLKMLIIFIDFLEKFLGIDRKKLRFSTQIHNDVSAVMALRYWSEGLNVNRNQFYKTQILKTRGKGTYKNKSKYGSVILYLNNVKLKKLLCNLIEKTQ